jgi:hypothetical protein
MISHKHKFIFIHIPKTAGTSIEKALRDESCVLVSDTWDRKKISHAPLNHLTLPEIADNNFISQKQLKSYFKFCFVRNPWDKAVAEVCCRYISYSFEELSVEQSLEKVCRLATTRKGFGNHLRPQYDFVDCPGIVMDFVGRFEHLQEDFDDVCDRLGLDRIALPHLNRSEHKPYWQYYNRHTMALVAKTYRRDIEQFGYDFVDRQLYSPHRSQPDHRVKPFTRRRR